jgi:bacterioferritin-associated ferredoxin
MSKSDNAPNMNENYYVCLGKNIADSHPDEKIESCGWNSLDSGKPVSSKANGFPSLRLTQWCCPKCRGLAAEVPMEKYSKLGIETETILHYKKNSK